MSEEQVPGRADIDPQDRWNAPSVFPSDDDWKVEIDHLIESVADIRKWQGKLDESAPKLAQALDEIFEYLRRVGVAYMYASVSRAVDTTDQAAAERSDIASALYGQALAAAAFVEPELLKIDQAVLEGWMDQEPGLQVYRHFLDNLWRRQTHVRSTEIEELLGLVNDPFSTVSGNYSMLTDSDIQFRPALDSSGNEFPLTQGTVDEHKYSPDREVRRTSWENYHDQFLAFRNTMASNLSASLKQNVFFMRARKHESTLGMALFDDNVRTEVFHNLIDVFQKNIGVWHRYWQLKKKALGLKEMHSYDIWAPLTEKPYSVPYEKAVDWICASLTPLGDEYVSVLRRGCLQDRWIDKYPNIGKTAGAFSYGSHGTHPFIVMSYTDDVLSMGTLAHELGHSMHSYLTWETQPPVYGDYSIFVAEVASNFHQAMVRAHLLKDDTDPALQIGIIEEAMSNFHRYFLIMPTLAQFELEIHQRIERGQGLTADGMTDLLADLFSEGYGQDMELDRQRVGIRWATFGHLYSDYYVYQYATGISGAHALANRVLSGEENAAEDYLRFLRAGGSMYPLDALKMAGVDLSKPEPVETTFEILADLIERLDQLVN
ncbi:MAG: oligoendopeptidase F [Anaerolineae bacterium]|nr:MAG: oligoendopeptidase F [Anaerolineae bacterium]